MLTFSTNGGDWKKAFYQVIPPRKLDRGETVSDQTEQSEVKVHEQSTQSTNDVDNPSLIVCDQSTDESSSNSSHQGDRIPAHDKPQLREGSLFQSKHMELAQNSSSIDSTVISTTDNSITDDKLIGVTNSKLERGSDWTKETVDSTSTSIDSETESP